MGACSAEGERKAGGDKAHLELIAAKVSLLPSGLLFCSHTPLDSPLYGGV